jgi:ubiquinone/menaquinone biosynthesis C-methylase UbiE
MNETLQLASREGMVYEVMDATAMSYPSKYFDLVLDKSTLDALMCSYHPWIESAKMVQEIGRVMKDDGVYLAISYGEPENRMKHFTR